MSQPDAPEADRIDPVQHKAYTEIAASTEFLALRKRFLSFVFPATAVFMIWYVIYVLCNNWARDFMDIQVIGNINIALIFGLLQFVSTFVIAILYARHANREIDPTADRLRRQFDDQVAAKEDR